jgi:hypothetical protein
MNMRVWTTELDMISLSALTSLVSLSLTAMWLRKLSGYLADAIFMELRRFVITYLFLDGGLSRLESMQVSMLTMICRCNEIHLRN